MSSNEKSVLIKNGRIIDPVRHVDKVADFLHTQAKLPPFDRNYVPAEPIEISAGQSRQEIIDYLQQKRATNTTVDLAFYACRDMQNCDWLPFVKAAMERNPVSLQMAQSMSIEQVSTWLADMNNISIYDGARLAQPDEVANYLTGDGLEKAFMLANVIRNREPKRTVEIVADANDVVLKARKQHRFTSTKGLKKRLVSPSAGNFSVTG